MKILVAPDKFKGSLTAREAAEAIARGLAQVLRVAEIRTLPVADGGEGTAEAICGALDGQWIPLAVRNPIGVKIDARYAWIARDSTAVIEMSEAAGLHRVSMHQRDPLRSSTFGVGEMIRDAVRRGAKKIIAGLGGSATNDGGIGMAAALGFEFLTSDGEALEAIPANLLALTRITAPESGEWLRLATPNDQPEAGVIPSLEDNPTLPSHVVGALVSSAREATSVAQVRAADTAAPTSGCVQLSSRDGVTIIAACDVRNPLLGERGATRVYGPQKGADANSIEILEQGLKNLADVVAQEFGVDFRDTPGAGAAGGLGFGLMSFCGATIRPGFEVVAEVLNLENAIAASDLVITGEGRIDAQTLEGKAAAGVATLARRHGKRVIAIAGSIGDGARLAGLFDATYSLVDDQITLADAMRESAVHLQACAARAGRESQRKSAIYSSR